MRARRPLSINDVDFKWVKKVPPHVVAMAAWYEYARESKPLIERVNVLRKAKMFASEGGADVATIKEHCTQHLAIIPLRQVQLLVCCKDFPAKPIIRANFNTIAAFMLDDELFGTDGPVALPWTTYFGLKGLDMAEAYAKWHLRLGRSIHPISIPWQYTNPELIEMFGPIIKRLRPREFPEPTRAGRKGRIKSRGGLELLQQLVAYRLTSRRMAFDDRQWRSFHVYGTKRGFEKAARAAADRISRITEVSFFGRNAYNSRPRN
jgi:hypothetical protein